MCIRDRYKKVRQFFVADTLSRAAVRQEVKAPFTVMQEGEVFRLELAQMDLSPNQIIANTIRCTWEETSKDPVLTVLHKVVLSRWPSERKEVPE